jgi:hypothetical protein
MRPVINIAFTVAVALGWGWVTALCVRALTGRSHMHFSDKQTLFQGVALGRVGHVGSDFQAQVAAAAAATDVDRAL